MKENLKDEIKIYYPLIERGKDKWGNECYDTYCPICGRYFQGSEYLGTIFKDDEKILWLSNMITHYRHTHITSWNKCWGYGGGYYRGHWFGDYDEEKAKVNERAKRQIIRKCVDYLKYYGFNIEDFKKLQNTTEETIALGEKLLKI